MNITLDPGKLVKFLYSFLGPNTTVSFFQIRQGRCLGEIVADPNGYRSRVGDTLPKSLRRFLAEKAVSLPDYEFFGADTEPEPHYHVSAMFLKEYEQVIGILAVFTDIAQYIKICDDVLKLSGVNGLSALMGSVGNGSAVDVGDDHAAVDRLTISAMKECVKDSRYHAGKFTSREKCSIVRTLRKRGVFAVKGSVSRVAEHLNCSEASVYRYLSKKDEEL